MSDEFITRGRKRRRLDEPSALSKPFKSPFRPAPASASATLTSNAESAESSPHDTSRPEMDEETLNLFQQKESLESQVEILRDSLDKMNQALRIQRSGKVTELEALIMKWRCISQTAADEVFVGAKERVDRMGGVTAWRQRNMRDSSQWGFDNSDTAFVDGTTQREKDPAEQQEADREFTLEFMLNMLNIEYALIGFEPEVGTWIDEF